jgi:hypothetical protein
VCATTAFPALVSSARFMGLLPTILVPLTAYLHRQPGTCTSIDCAVSTDLAVCHTVRIGQQRVFVGRAGHDPTSVDRFFGFT